MMQDLSSWRRQPVVRAIDAAMRDVCGVQPGDRLLLAVSGGADSTGLLAGVYALAGSQAWALDVHVGHVLHDLRDEAADDAEHVRAMCDALHLPMHQRAVHVERVGNIEANARRVRYAALHEMALQIDADHVATAHHLCDQFETMMMRLMRGTATTGISGIAPHRKLKPTDSHSPVALIRPMLSVAPDAIRTMLRALNLAWCEDATNRDITQRRAALRHMLIPWMNELDPAAIEKCVQSLQSIRDEHHLLNMRARKLLHRNTIDLGPPHTLDRSALRDYPVAMVRRVLHMALTQQGVKSDALPRRTLEQLAQAVRDTNNTPRDFHLQGARMRIETESITIEPENSGRDC